MSKMENQLEKILPIVTGNQDVSKEVKYLKTVASQYKNDQPQQMLNTIQNYLRDQNDGEKRIKNMCVMNETVMPYIIQNKGEKNNTTTVTVYNKLNEQRSYWYNYFYGIIFAIEKSQDKKLTKEDLTQIKNDLEKLCNQFAKSKGFIGDKSMTGGFGWQLIPLLVLAAGSIVNGEGYSLPSEKKFDPSALSDFRTTTDYAEIGVHAVNFLGHAGAAVGLSLTGVGVAPAMGIATSYLYTEGAFIVGSATKSFMGLTEREQRENYGKITNEVATQFRDFIPTGKTMVTKDLLISDIMEKQFKTKIIKVDGKVIAQNSEEYTAIRESVRFINHMAERRVYDVQSQEYMAEHAKYSKQSAQPVGDGKGIAAKLGIGDGKTIRFEDMAVPFKEYVNGLETLEKNLLDKAHLSTDDIQQIKKFLKDFEGLYLSSEITISGDTLKVMKLLSSVINNKGWVNRLIKDDFYTKASKHYNTFKSKIDGVELNAGYNFWWMATQSIGGLFFIYFIIKAGAISQFGSIFKSEKKSKKNNDNLDDDNLGDEIEAFRNKIKEAKKTKNEKEPKKEEEKKTKNEEEPKKEEEKKPKKGKSEKKNNSKQVRTPEEEVKEEPKQSFFGSLFGPRKSTTSTSTEAKKNTTIEQPRRSNRLIELSNVTRKGGRRKTKSNKIRKTKKNYKRSNKKRVK